MARKRIITTIFKWTLLLLLVGYSAWISVWARGEAESRVCRDIVVDITTPTSSDSITRRGVIMELSRLPKKIKGMPLSKIDVNGIERHLSALSNFENVECNLTSTGKLKVTVSPMVPVMRIFSGGKSYYVNKDGKWVESNPDFYVDVPVVSGRFSRSFTPGNILPVIDFIKSDPFLDNFVSMTIADDPSNIILVPRILGHVINIGDVSRLGEKRDALLLFYRKVIPYKGWEEYDTISVKFRGQVVATRRDKTVVMHGLDEVEEVDMEEATLPDVSGREAEADSVAKKKNAGSRSSGSNDAAGEKRGNQHQAGVNKTGHRTA